MSARPIQEETESEHDAPAGAGASRGRTVRGHLTLLTISIVLPVLFFAGFLLWQFATSERLRLEREASDIAQSVSLAIDREMTGIFASLDVLSTSAFLQAGDFDGFRRQAAVILDRQGIVTVVTDMSGQQLVNLRLPAEAALPRSSLALDQTSLATGRPFVTDLVIGQVSRNKQFLAVTSVVLDGRPAYVLMFSLQLDRLQRILRDADIPPSYTASIVDRTGTIIARSLRPDEFVGQKASADLQSNATGTRGTWSGSTVDGTPVFGAYERSVLTGFRAAVGIQFADLDAPVWASLALFAGLGVAITALSVLLGLFFGRRIASSIGTLARQAEALGRGEPVTPITTRVSEANQVGAVLARASDSLRDRESDLREANDEIQRFAYIVSHDLRSPLVNIMGFTTELEALRGDIFTRLDELRRAAAAAQADAGREGGKDDETRPRLRRGDRLHQGVHLQDGPPDQRHPAAVARGTSDLPSGAGRHGRAGRLNQSEPDPPSRGGGCDGDGVASPVRSQRPAGAGADLLEPDRQRAEVSAPGRARSDRGRGPCEFRRHGL